MSYQAHVTEESYRYDGSYAGFLCCIFESFRCRELPAAILSPECGQTSLFGCRDIPTDPGRARRVAAGIDRMGPYVRQRITRGFLADSPDREMILLRFARLCFERGPSAAAMLGDPDVQAAFRLERAVNGEAGKCLQFIRFEYKDGMYGARIHPTHRVLPLLQRHFCERLGDEDFLIFDATHAMALVRKDGNVQYLEMERYLPSAEEEERQWQRLWKDFFGAVTIEERRNLRTQQTHVPRRWWKDMLEMQPDADSGQKI